MKNQTKYDTIIDEAIMWMEQEPELEPTSALRECAIQAGIKTGKPLLEFMTYANAKLFPTQ